MIYDLGRFNSTKLLHIQPMERRAGKETRAWLAHTRSPSMLSPSPWLAPDLSGPPGGGGKR